MQVSCSVKCSGTGSLEYGKALASAASKKKHKPTSSGVLASFKFSLSAKGSEKVTARLTSSGRKLFAKKKRLIVAATITVKIGNARPKTYSNAVDVTRSTPTGLHKKSLRMTLRLP
jgi:hypothetical protein